MPTKQEQPKLEWQEWLRDAITAEGRITGIYDRFHDYSLTNQMNFRAQGIREPVASYKRWLSLGRHVKNGAKAKFVIVPVVIKTGEPGLDEGHDQLVGFRLVRGVFTVSDTEGAELPPVPTPGWDLKQALGNLGIREVSFDETNGNIQGYSRGLEFAVNPVAVHPTKTRFHEIAHIVLGHTLPLRQPEYALHRSTMEGEAECTAYIAMHEVGAMDEETAKHSRGYIQDWLDREPLPERSIRRVFTAAEAILKAGRMALEHSMGIPPTQ